MDEKTWKVGEVAATSGLTVRTLHHWDSIGLLRPSRRGTGGHREYTGDDLGRLYLVLTLRGLGLSLESIGTCLDAGIDPTQLLNDHLAQIDETVTTLAAVRTRVVALSQALTAAADPTPALIDVLSSMNGLTPRSEAALARHLDDEQLSVMQERPAALGSARHYLHKIVWPQLYRQVDELRKVGRPPEDPQVQHLVGRMAELGAAGTGGRADVSEGVRAAWRDDPAALSGNETAPVDEWRALADFVEQARTVTAQEDKS